MSLAELQDQETPSTCAILLPAKWSLEEGAPLWGGVKLGRLLGAGVQAKVFELDYADGRPTGKVLKVAHTDLGHRMLNNPVIWIGMEREWEIGTQLRAALEEEPGKLPGFMRMCDCLVQTHDPGSGKAAFSGMIMEKLNGWELYKRIDTPEFHNIHYVREMLFQVLSALDRAQRKLGFHHADLGMRNVMEHYPILWSEVGRDAGAEAAAGQAGPGAHRDCLPCKQQQAGAAAVAAAAPAAGSAPVGGGLLPQHSAGSAGSGQGQPWWRLRTQGSNASCSKVRPRPGFSCNADGTRLPLGPHVEFKIIDFGLAVFDERLAQAAGGYESEAVMSRLNEIFAAKQITFGSQGPSRRSIEMETSEGATPGGQKKSWHLVPTGTKNRFGVKQTPPGAHPVPTAQSLEADGLPAVPELAGIAGAAGAAGAAATNGGGGSADLPQRFRSATLLRRPGEGLEKAGELMRASLQAAGAQQAQQGAAAQQGPGGGDGPVRPNPQRGASRPASYKQSPIEKMYRRFWQHKGDVFHLLVNMALVLDDRVWPKEDERDVQLFISLVHHVTGVRMRASFAREGEGQDTGLFGRLACGAAPRVKGWVPAAPRHASRGRARSSGCKSMVAGASGATGSAACTSASWRTGTPTTLVCWRGRRWWHPSSAPGACSTPGCPCARSRRSRAAERDARSAVRRAPCQSGSAGLLWLAQA
ncbi:hypothetical protein ABPG75_005810 [Micractinium tetrahymenae]